MSTVPQTEKQRLLVQLEACRIVVAHKLADLRHKREALACAQSAYEQANADYHRVAYELLTYEVRHT